MRQLGDIAKQIAARPPEPAKETPPAEQAEPAPRTASGRPSQLSARAPHRGHLARELVQCTLPHRDPKKDVYIRKDGNFRLVIESGTNLRTEQKYGIPYGILPRLLMLFVNSEAVRKQGREDQLVISFGGSMNEFLRNVGCNPATGGGKRGDAARIREQHTRLFNARFTFARLDGDDVFGSDSRKSLEIAREIRTFWDYRNPDQGTLWESYIVLTPEFHAALVANPVPFDFEHLKSLKRSALAIDLYCWLTYRIFRANNDGFNVPLKDLYQQFGTGYGRLDHFKSALEEALQMVTEVYSAIRYEFTPRGLAVEPISRRDLPVPSDPKPPQLLVPGHGAPAAERPYDGRHLVVMGTDLRKIQRVALRQGLVLDEVMEKWRQWCIAERIQPANAAAHLTSFIKNHDPSRGQ